MNDSRVDGKLALSRGFGDFQFKDRHRLKPEEQAVTANPDVVCRDRHEEDQFIILASDGVWDCLTTTNCINELKE